MAGQPRKVDLLIACDHHLSKQLCERLSEGVRPIQVAINPLAAEKVGGPVHGSTLPVVELIAQVLYGDVPNDAVSEWKMHLNQFRGELGLEQDELLKLALCGTHTSLTQGIERASAGKNPLAPDKMAEINALRTRGRALIGLLDIALEKVSGIRPISLAEAFPHLRPKPRSSKYDKLVEQARDVMTHIRLPPADFGIGPLKLRRPAAPIIFVSRENGPADEVSWKPFESEGKATLPSDTEALISTFAKQKAKDTKLRGVLTKLLPAEIDNERGQNRLDAPLIGHQTIDSVKSAGIESILLDARYGVIRDETISQAERDQFIYGCP